MSRKTFFALYDRKTGRIVSVGETMQRGEIRAFTPLPGQGVLTGFPMTRDQAEDLYVDPASPDAPRRRPSVEVTLSGEPPRAGIDTLSTQPLPAGVQVYIDDALTAETTQEEEVVIEFTTDGVFDIRIAPPFPWIPFEQTVRVTA